MDGLRSFLGEAPETSEACDLRRDRRCHVSRAATDRSRVARRMSPADEPPPDLLRTEAGWRLRHQCVSSPSHSRSQRPRSSRGVRTLRIRRARRTKTGIGECGMLPQGFCRRVVVSNMIPYAIPGSADGSLPTVQRIAGNLFRA